MSIVKMKAVTISGQLDDFDYLVEKYVYNRDIHIENAVSLISDRKGLSLFRESNEYDSVIKSINSVLEISNLKPFDDVMADNSTSIEYIKNYVNAVNRKIDDEKRLDEKLNKQIQSNAAVMDTMDKMLDANVRLEALNKMEFISCRFGHIPLESYKTLNAYLGNLETFFVRTYQSGNSVWGFYFSPKSEEERIDEIFNSLYFQRVELPVMYSGTPMDIHTKLKRENDALKRSVDENRKEIAEVTKGSQRELSALLNLAKKRQSFSDIRKKAIHSELLFFITGWMDVKSARQLEKEIKASGDSIMCYFKDPNEVVDLEPPTKLKNNAVFKPFEMFVKMYGLPMYNEIDPTPILAITYILFFGIMFGDVGQSLVLSIAGFILYKIKKWDLGGIVGFVGISGAIFGFLYGSFFGNEEIIPKLFHTWALRPMEQIGVMLGGTIAMGVIVIIFGMALNMVNSVREGHIGRCLVNHNGLAGIVFYAGLLVFAGNLFLKLGIPNNILLGIILLSVVVMFLEEPLEKLIEGKKDWMPKSGMFFVESFFELFEVLLSFFSNTISFLRIGAFAIVHVGMMQVVAVLSASGGVGGAIVQVIGNIIVMCLEGLIVGIQVLRLEYYEMFSRYFTGGGKEFVSQKVKG